MGAPVTAAAPTCVTRADRLGVVKPAFWVGVLSAARGENCLSLGGRCGIPRGSFRSGGACRRTLASTSAAPIPARDVDVESVSAPGLGTGQRRRRQEWAQTLGDASAHSSFERTPGRGVRCRGEHDLDGRAPNPLASRDWQTFARGGRPGIESPGGQVGPHRDGCAAHPPPLAWPPACRCRSTPRVMRSRTAATDPLGAGILRFGPQVGSTTTWP